MASVSTKQGIHSSFKPSLNDEEVQMQLIIYEMLSDLRILDILSFLSGIHNTSPPELA
jgi:hypothetical protein